MLLERKKKTSPGRIRITIRIWWQDDNISTGNNFCASNNLFDTGYNDHFETCDNNH